MKCPYLVCVEYVQRHKYEYDDDSRSTGQQNFYKETQKPSECLKEECAVWQGGKCCYKG